MRHVIKCLVVTVAGLLLAACKADAGDERRMQVGPLGNGAHLVSTKQIIRPVGQSVEYHGRPVDLVLSPDGLTVYVKDSGHVTAIDVGEWKIRKRTPWPEKTGASMHGLAITRDGKRLYSTGAQGVLIDGAIAADGSIKWEGRLEFKSINDKASYPCGVALSADEKFAYVCLSVNNSLAIVNLERKQKGEIAVGVAPYGVVLSGDGKTAYVSNWGGRRAKANEATTKSAGTDVLIDDHGVASSGTVSIVDLDHAREVGQVEVGLHPSDMTLSRDGKTLFVANANSDSVSVIDIPTRKVRQTISTRPDANLPFGSASNALCLSKDESTLYVANGGNNAIAVVPLGSEAPTPSGFIPTAWYPGGSDYGWEEFICCECERIRGAQSGCGEEVEGE